jgi:hypothetical protein
MCYEVTSVRDLLLNRFRVVHNMFIISLSLSNSPRQRTGFLTHTHTHRSMSRLPCTKWSRTGSCAITIIRTCSLESPFPTGP